MSKDKKRKGLGGLSDDQIEILYRQTQDGMRKKGLPGKRTGKNGQRVGYSDEDHSRARTVDKDFYRGKGTHQYRNSPDGRLRRMFGDKPDPETDPSSLFNEAFGDSYQRKNLSHKDVANMMIEVKDERYKRKFGDKGNGPVAGSNEAPAPEEETVTDKPDTRPNLPSQPDRPSMFDKQMAEGNSFDPAKDGNPIEAPGLAEYAKAKEKAQAFSNKSGSNIDYSFEGGSYGDQPESGVDQYGNATADKVKEEHASNLLNKYKSSLVSGGQ